MPVGICLLSRHYAGHVLYDIHGMIEKNRDLLPVLVKDCLSASRWLSIACYLTHFQSRSALFLFAPRWLLFSRTLLHMSEDCLFCLVYANHFIYRLLGCIFLCRVDVLVVVVVVSPDMQVSHGVEFLLWPLTDPVSIHVTTSHRGENNTSVSSLPSFFLSRILICSSVCFCLLHIRHVIN